MKKQLIIQAKFDTGDFDRSITQMQQKLRDLYAPSDRVRAQAQTADKLNQLGMGGIHGPTNAAQTQAATQYRRNLDTYIREEYKKQEELVKLLGKREEKLKSLQEKQKDMLKGSKEELEIKERIARVEDNQARKRQEYNQRDQAINQAADIKRQQQFSMERLSTAYEMGGIGGAARAGGRMAGQAFRANPVGVAAGILGAMGTAIGVGGELYGNYTQSPLRTAGNLGAGIQSTVGQESQIIGARRSVFEAAFNAERSRAAQMAVEANRGARVQTGAGLAGNILGMGGAGAAAGSFFPGPGTAIGAAGGIVYGAYRSFSDPAQRALAMSALPGGIGKRYGNEYESIMARRLGENYSQSLQDLRNQNPGKNLASGYYEQNYMQNLKSQRSMGMGNSQFYGAGGFLQSGVNAGFTPEMMTGAAAGILGVGGSTRSAVGNALFANQLSRNMDLTNAQQVLGTLSGGIGGSQATQQATIKIIAEGMKLGLDSSRFVEENRRFTQVAAEIISRSGAGGPGDFARVAGGFSRFLVEPTAAGIGAAQSAYQRYQDISSSVTGPRGVMRMAGFLSDEKLNQLSTMEKQALSQIPENQLNENHPVVVGLASKYGIPVSEFVERISNVNEGAVSRFASTDKARDRLRSTNVDVRRALSDSAYRSSLTRQQQDDITAIGVSRMVEFGNEGPRELAAGIAGQVGGGAPGISDTAVGARMGRGSGRGEDVTVTETAKDFGIVLQNFRDFKKEIMPSADAVANFTGKVREMMIVLRNATESEIPGLMKAYNQRAINQVQGGKPSR